MREADPRIAEAHRMPMAGLVDRLQIGSLVRTSGELVGPCPGAGCGGTDRFGINLQKQIFNCRVCGAKGDQIALVQLVLGMDFPAALDWLVGPAQQLTPEQRAEVRRREEENKAKRDATAERKRREAIDYARKLWAGGQPADDTIVVDYLARRGLAPRPGARLPRCFRFEPQVRLVVEIPDRPREYQTMHEGPVMLSAIAGLDGQVIGVHRTWIDLSQPKGRPVIPHPYKAGETVPTKKVLGSAKGGAIRLFTPAGARALVMGEGIETTLTAMKANAVADAAYWAGVSLGNMGGQRQLGRGLKFAGLPDLTDKLAFVPPEWVQHLIFLQDGDSEPKLTRAKLLSGLRRAKALRPGLTAAIVHPGEGVDMNDLLMGEGNGDA